MRNTDYFKNKKITIIGLARSGVACANLLFGLGAEVGITDNKDTEAVRSNLKNLNKKDIRLELGAHTPEFISDSDTVIVSPGVPDDAPAVIWAQGFGIPVISEVEFAWMLCPTQVIAITGSNGKTTVTTLIADVLRKNGSSVFLCGNIGNPFSAEVDKMKQGDFVALEVSSFQLERIKSFKPKISVILNFAANHLDRHKSLQEYLDAKKRIFMNQDKEDYLLLNGDDPVLKGLASESRAKAVYFYETQDLNQNQAAVMAVGSVLKIDKQLTLEALREFKGIEHRLEYVAKINNIKFINDSKSTTADSALWALRNIREPVVLIAGGRHKGSDYRSILKNGSSNKVKRVILIGEAKELIRRALKDHLLVEEAASLEEAVFKAYSSASAGDGVLLSPMCSSFDMFSNYEERGDCFKKIVHDIAKKSGNYAT